MTTYSRPCSLDRGPPTGVSLSADGRFLSVFSVANDADDPEWVGVSYEGGSLFEPDGEEESYELEDLPALAKTLRYRPDAELPMISGLTSEHALFALLPELPDPDTVWGEEEQKQFAALALSAAGASEVVTVAAVG
ncbi:hypothetical protein D9M70_377860 [compost metagenome]